MSVTTVGYVDKVERNGDYYDIHDTLLRNIQGQANGIATLDSTGKLTTSQKPTYTATDVGLGNVDNTSDSTKKTNFTGAIEENNTGFVTGGDAYTALTGKLSTALKGANNGLAELGSDGKVPASQLPSYVDDVVEVDDYAHLPITGESGKIYLTVNDNKQYRWTGTTYAEISSSLALGETSETAYRGDRGKTAYDHATETKLGTATSSGFYKVAATAQGHIASLTDVTKSDITALGIPDTDTNVKQSPTTSNNNYEILLSGSADNTEHTEGVKKSNRLTFNHAGGLGNGDGVSASGVYSHAEGYHTTSGDYSHAEGDATYTSDGCNHAEGYATSATSIHTHAEGCGTCAGSNGSHAEGCNTRTSNSYSHSEGYGTTASGEYSHAEGVCTSAAGEGQLVVGKYNTPDTTSLFIIGNGTATTARSNAMTVSTEGHVTSNKLISRELNGLLTGIGTAGTASGSTYYPAKWTFDTGLGLNDGDIVTIKTPTAGYNGGVYLSIDSGTTYKPISRDYGTGRLTTHFPVNSNISLVYDPNGSTATMYPLNGGTATTTITGGCWRVVNFYDSNDNTYDRNRYNAAIKAGSSALSVQNIIVGKDGTFHHLKDGTAFDITYPILYLGENVGANSSSSNVYDIIPFNIATTQSITLTPYLPVYIKGTLSGTTFTPVSTTPLTQTVPTTADGYHYILLGVAYAASSIYLQERHPIYTYKNGIFGLLDLSKFAGDSFISGNKDIATHDADAMTVNGHYYYSSNGPTTAMGATTNDGAMFVQAYGTNWVGQIAQDYRDGDLFVRGKKNNTWQYWKKVMCFEDTFGLYYTLDPGNYWFSFEPITRKIFYHHAAASGWAQQIYSAHGYSDNVYLSFKAGQANGGIMLGLDANPSQDANYNKIDYCWYIQTSGIASIYESGTDRGVMVGSYSAGDEFTIEYTGGYIRYYYNGVVLREVARAISGKLYFDSSEHTQGIFNIYDFTFGTCANTTYTTQTATNTNAEYEVLFSATADNTTRTEGARKYNNFVFNPNIGTLFAYYYGSPPTITSRITSIDFSTSNAGTGRTKVRFDLVTSSITNNLPPGVASNKLSAGYLHTYFWENNTTGGQSQLYIPNGDHLSTRNGPQPMMLRGNDGGTWTDWMKVGSFACGDTITSGQVLVSDGTLGIIKTSGYTIAKSVPSDAVFTDTNNAVTQTATSTSAAYEVLFSATADNTTRTEGARKNSNLLFNPSGGVLYSMTEVRSTNLSVSASNGTSGGISLYGTASSMDKFGVMFRKTSNKGVHGDTTGDWATYFTMYNDTSSKRGWIFQHYNSGNVASINTVGNAVFNGSVTIGGNDTNTSGATLSFNSSNNCIDVLFV